MKKVILIVDDEKDICLLLKSILEKMNYQVIVAYNIKEGKEKLNEREIDIVFLDLNLPDGIGFSLIPTIKKIQPNSKIIINSAYDSPRERTKAYILGANFFVEKPFSIDKVKKALLAISV